jgi:hypothetical protein
LWRVLHPDLLIDTMGATTRTNFAEKTRHMGLITAWTLELGVALPFCLGWIGYMIAIRIAADPDRRVVIA